jgi:hypothetical protein
MMAKQTTNYIDGSELAEELHALKESGTISDNLGEMFLKIVNNMANRKNFINYTFKEEMKGRGLIFLCKYAKSFDKDNPKANAFAYVSMICFRGFVQCIKEEQKHSAIKDGLIKRNMETSEQEKFINEKNEELYD